MSHIAITFAIVAAIVVLFVWNCVPVVLVALGTALALYFTGVLNLTESLGGLGDPPSYSSRRCSSSAPASRPPA